VTAVGELVLSENDQLQINCLSTLNSTIWDLTNLFFMRSWFEVVKETPAGQLIETNRHARLFCSKQLLNDVVFIRFSDETLSH